MLQNMHKDTFPEHDPPHDRAPEIPVLTQNVNGLVEFLNVHFKCLVYAQSV